MSTTSKTINFHQYLGEQQVLWDRVVYSTHDRLPVTEIWHQCESGEFTVSHHSIDGDALKHWLDRTNGSNQTTEDNVQQKCLMRMVRIALHLPKRLLNIDETMLYRIHDAFHQRLPFQYLQTQSAGINSISDTESSMESFLFCVHPKMAMTWTQDPKTGVLNVVCIAIQPKLTMIRELLEYQFIQRLAHLKLMPVLLCAIVCSRDIDTAIERVKTQVREVEVRTGFHEWASRTEPRAKGDLEELSAKMSGCGTRAASSRRRLDLLDQMTRFVDDYVSNDTGSSNDELLSTMDTLKQRNIMQKIDLDYTQCRAQIQRDALFHLVSSNDSVSSQAITGKPTKSLVVRDYMFRPQVYLYFWEYRVLCW